MKAFLRSIFQLYFNFNFLEKTLKWVSIRNEQKAAEYNIKLKITIFYVQDDPIEQKK